MKSEIEIDETLIPEGYEAIEFRKPTSSDDGCLNSAGYFIKRQDCCYPRLILRKKSETSTTSAAGTAEMSRNLVSQILASKLEESLTSLRVAMQRVVIPTEDSKWRHMRYIYKVAKLINELDSISEELNDDSGTFTF